MILSDKNKFEFEIRNIGGSDVYYKRNVGDKLWLFSTKEEFELNKNIMDKKYSESAIKKGTEIEMEHAETIKKFMRDGVSVKEVARAIAIDHLEESPTYYEDLKEEYSIGGGVSDRIECHNPKCNWNWSVESGGDDLYVCHKCNTDNEKFYVKGGSLENDFEIEENEDGDRITISLKGIGEVILVQTSPEYEFTEDIDEDTLEELNVSDGDMIGKIEHLEVNDKFKGKGYAKSLMNKAIEIAEEYGWMPLYLNASPMGSKRYGLGIEDLTGFYESFGFNVFLNQGGNNLMLLNKKEKFSKGGLITPIEFSIGNTYYYKNQYMDEPISVKLVDKKEWSNGEIESLILKKDDGYILTLKKDELEYLFQKKLIIDGYFFTKKFDDFVSYQIGYYPEQSFGLIEIIDNKKLNGNFTLSFVEEVKDGRSSSFNVSKPLKLKNKTFSYNGISLKINNIKYIDSNQQESESDNEYFNYYYNIDVILNLDGNNPDIRFDGGGSTDKNYFKNWFKNSKVVDKKGNPLIVYHGSPDLRGLKENYIFESRFSDNKSFFFTDNYSMAKSYADPQRAFDYQNAEQGVIGLYLSLQNPLIVNALNQIWRKFEITIDGNEIVGTKNLIKFAKDKGYDGVIVQNVRDYYNANDKKIKGGNVYVAFEPNQIKLADGTNTTFDGNNPDIRFDGGGAVEDLISQGIVELKMFATKPEHAKEYGLDSINPLYVQSLNVNENKRLKGVGKKVLEYIDDYAIKNGHDVVFGHINKKATMKKDNRTGYFTVFTDIDYIKHWLFRNGYSVNQENNDFHKVVISDSKDINDESKSDIHLTDGNKIQLNSNKGKVNLKLSSYEDVTELVPVSELLKFREFNRFERPKYSLEDSKDNISKLEKALVENGVEEPLIIEYSLEDNSVLLIEGNHRLNVAENLGFDYLPARVVLRRREFAPLQKTKALKVKGFTPDRYGYVPSDLKPSQVGIGGTTKAFEEGGVVEGQLHSECNEETGCGEKYDVGGVGHIIEVERDEAVIVSKAFQDNNQYEIKGTPSEIASALNVLGDGKNFDSGAEIKSEDGKKVEVAEIKKEAKNTDVETIDPNSIIINRRSMYDKKEYVAKGTPKEIASQINNLNDNGVKIVDGGSIKKA